MATHDAAVFISEKSTQYSLRFAGCAREKRSKSVMRLLPFCPCIETAPRASRTDEGMSAFRSLARQL